MLTLEQRARAKALATEQIARHMGICLTPNSKVIDGEICKPCELAALTLNILAEWEGDTRRLDWLDNFVQHEGCFESCFELDGGVHITLSPVGGPENGIAYRDKNDIRCALDAAIEEGEKR